MEADEIRAMTVDLLKGKLRELGLNCSGCKSELQNRLFDHYGLVNEALNSNDSTESANPTQVDATLGDRRVSTRKRTVFTLQDIKEGITEFKGDKDPNITQWITEFEDLADTIEWDDLQKFVYAKQLLKGAAKLYVRGLSGIRGWSTLKEALKEEFGEVANAAETHKMLRNRKKLAKESNLEFLYALIEMGKPISLDEGSIIEYFADGLPDSRSSKTILYQAKTLKELRQAILVFEKVKGSDTKSSVVMTHLEHTGSQNAKVRESGKKCFKCGSEGHLAKDCRRGLVCFKCKQTGHYSYQCAGNKKTVVNPKTEKANIVKEDYSGASKEEKSQLVFEKIQINGATVEALVDTGSEKSLMRLDTQLIIGCTEVKNEKSRMIGMGRGRFETIGCFDTFVEVGRCKFPLTFHLVKEHDMPYAVVLGRDILKEVDLMFIQEGVRFRKRDNVETNQWEKPLLLQEFNTICLAAEPKIETKEEDSLDLSHLPEFVAEKVRALIRGYKPTKPKYSPVSMKIIMADEVPIYQPPRRVSMADREIIDQQVHEWLEEGIVVPSFSEYASPVVLVTKKDGTKRLCCDYRRLNEKILRDNFPMAQMDETIERLQGSKVFITLDLKNGFLHVPIEEGSRKYTSFVTHNGQYEFCFVPFGISNSPAVFCRYIQAIFRELVREGTVVIYMDDMVIPAKTEDEGLEKLKYVLSVGHKNGLKIKWSKCQMLKKRISFLGYTIEDGTITPSNEKTKAIDRFPVPRNRKELQRYLGLTSYFRRFVDNFARIARPLTNLLRKEEEFVIGVDELASFEQLKQLLVRAPVLRLFNHKATTEVHTDASKHGYGAVLLQKDSEDQLFHPVEFMSRKTSEAEERYSAYELEVLGVVQALKKWRCYLKDKRFKVVTDCNAFASTVKKKDMPDRVMRWAMYLQQYDYVVEHRVGARMKHADALSRVCCLLVEDSLKFRLGQAQAKDEWLRAIREVLKTGEFEDYFLKNGLVFRNPDKELLVIPSVMEEEIIRIAHEEGHFGVKKTCEVVASRYFIPDMAEKVRRIVQGCIKCIIVEAKAGKREGLLMPIDKSSEPLGTYHLDHVGPLTETKKRYNHILVVVDGFSKFVWLYPTRSTGSEEVIEKLRRQSSVWGNPRRFVTDRGSAFTSRTFKKYCEEESIQHLQIATGVPRGNGQVERMHRILVPMLSKLCQENAARWYQYVDRVQRAINNSAPRSTKATPFRILTGLEMRVPTFVKIKELLDEEELRELDSIRTDIRQEAQKNIAKLQEENRRDFNRKRKPETEYAVGDLVAIKRTQFSTSSKLKPKFLGPYRVISKQNHGRYTVEKVGEHEGPNKTNTVADYMKRWGPSFGTNDCAGRPIVGSKEKSRCTRSGQTY